MGPQVGTQLRTLVPDAAVWERGRVIVEMLVSKGVRPDQSGASMWFPLGAEVPGKLGLREQDRAAVSPGGW